MQSKVVDIFNEEPECGWNCHGDAYLWNVLRGCFVFEGFELKTADEFEKRLRKCYREVIGCDLVREGKMVCRPSPFAVDLRRALCPHGGLIG